MVFTVLALFRRKPGTTPQQFKDYYENKHIPLLQELAGSSFPTFHKRHYLPRAVQDAAAANSDTSNTNYPAMIFAGSAADFQFDVYAEVIFEDVEHFKAFQAALGADPERPAAGEDAFLGRSTRLADDEAAFLDRGKMQVVVVGEPCVTAR
ncbi:hypothetical protein BJX99DRAFT_253483 [Aspergillus californicus]